MSDGTILIAMSYPHRWYFRIVALQSSEFVLLEVECGGVQLISRQETARSAHLDNRSNQYHASSRTRDSICTSPKRFTVVFENNTATFFIYTTIIFGQPAGLSRNSPDVILCG